MPLSPPHGSPNGHPQDHPSAPSQHTPSQRFLSQMLPALAPPSQGSISHQMASRSVSTIPSDASSGTTTVPRASTSATSAGTTPHKSALRLSHPPPAPVTCYLQHHTPQPKRARLSGDGPSSVASSSPLSHSTNHSTHSNAGQISGESLSSPSPKVRLLSGISRPLPLPPTPSPSQRATPSTSRHELLIPMPQRSVEDFQKLLPKRQHPAEPRLIPDTPRRALLQAVPPQPRLPPPTVPSRNRVRVPEVDQPQHTVENLPRRKEWLLTGFHSLDKDLERIAEISSLEHQRNTETEASDDPSTDSVNKRCRIRDSYLGSPDRGLPSGSVIEVLGPPGSGKSTLLVQMAVTERLRALERTRRNLSAIHQDQEQQPDLEIGHETAGDVATFAYTTYFSDDYWDAEVATADQILVIDCEGALTAERIADAAWSSAISLWCSSRHAEHDANSTEAADPPPSASSATKQQQRAQMPEVVCRLVAAILTGVCVSRVTSLAELIALLHSLRPTDGLQDPQQNGALPTSLPPRTSMVLIDSLSYHIRLSGGSISDRKAAISLSERIRDMLLRLQQPFEYRPNPVLSAEEQKIAKQRSEEAALKLCTPTIVFSNQLGMRRNRDEANGSGRSSPSGSRPGASGRPSSRNGHIVETSSMLAPVLNGIRPTQPARVRDEPAPPSVALCGPEMWDEDDCASPTAAATRQIQRLRSRGGMSNNASQHVGHDRGWPPSFLGQDVWRILLFRHGTFGQRYAQVVSVPPSVQGELGELWVQTRERRAQARERAEMEQETSPNGAAEEQGEAQQHAIGTDSEGIRAAKETAENVRDQQMLQLLSELRASLFRWRPFDVMDQGVIT